MIVKLAHDTDVATDSKTIIRTINVHMPDGQTNSIKQVAKLTRQGTKDNVTGKITWGAWTTGSWNAYQAPIVAGYTPSQAAIAQQIVNSDTQDATVDITYTANEQSVKVIYQTKDGQVVKTDVLHGKTGETSEVVINVPTGYYVVGEVPTTVEFNGNQNPDVIITVAKDAESAKPDQSSEPIKSAKPAVEPSVDHQSSVQPAAASAKGVASTAHQQKLPQTGNQQDTERGLGLLLGSFGLGLLGLLKKRRNERKRN